MRENTDQNNFEYGHFSRSVVSLCVACITQSTLEIESTQRTERKVPDIFHKGVFCKSTVLFRKSVLKNLTESVCEKTTSKSLSHTFLSVNIYLY